MSVAFDCVDHSNLLQRLHSTVGLFGVVLDWIDSFLSGRTQHSADLIQRSTIDGVRRSIRDSTGFSAWAAVVAYILYTAELAHVVTRHGLSLHQYADDCQVYTSSPVDGAGVAVDQLSTCLVDVEARCKPVVTVLTRVKHRSCSWFFHSCFPDSA